MKQLNKFYAIKIESWSPLKYIKGYMDKTKDHLDVFTTFHREEPSKESLKILFKSALAGHGVGSIEMTLFYDHKELNKWKYEQA